MKGINNIVVLFAAVLVCGWATVTTSAAPGDLDPSFGSGGIVLTSFTNSPYTDFPRSIQVQPDGRIVVCGRVTQYDPTIDESVTVSYFIARYYLNGTLDPSFGINGRIVAPINSGNELVGEDIALQPDGKIVAVGYRFIRSLGDHFAVDRYNYDGTLDDSFGMGGKVVTQVGNFSRANSVAIQPDGKIVVIGSASLQSFPRNLAVVRYYSNGTLDTGFGEGGRIFTPVFHYAYVEPVMLQPDGKIIVAGSIFEGGGGSGSFALVRYNADGSVDSDFGSGGIVIQTFPNADSYLNDALLQPDGRILVNGIVFSASTPRMAIVRYNSDGSVDTSFAANGIFTSPNTVFYGDGIALQSDSKIVSFGNYAYARSAVLRLNPDGSLDTGFGSNGRADTNFNIGTSYGLAGAIQSNGRILFLGYTWTGGGDIVLARFLSDSTVPHGVPFDFDGDLRADLSVFRPSDRNWYLDQSQAGFSATQFGISTDHLTPADFDGDGKTDIAVYRNGTWYWLSSTDGGSHSVGFGSAGDVPTAADYDGDGTADLSVFRQSNGTWYRQNSSNGQLAALQFGRSGDVPMPGDHDGDGKTDITVFRPENGYWYVYRSSDSEVRSDAFGTNGDIPLNGDFNGDGGADLAVFRPADATWYIARPTGVPAQNFDAIQFGISTDIPTPGDFDGDGKTDIAVYRGGTWYLLQSTGGFAATQFGLANDKPIPAAYLQR